MIYWKTLKREKFIFYGRLFMFFFVHVILNIYKQYINIFKLLFSASGPVMENGPQNQTILDGKDATLTCNAVAAPIPNTTWIYNGKSLIIKLINNNL